VKTRLFAPLIVAALLGAVSGAQTPPPDVSSLTLTSAGPLGTATAINKAVPLYWRDGRQRFAIGKVIPDGTLTLRIDPALRARTRVGSLLDWKTSHGRNCNVQGLIVEQDAKIKYLGAPEYDLGDQRYFVRPGTATRNEDGTITLRFLMFVYAESVGRLSGTETCGAEITTYDMTLHPGWNAIDETQVLGTDDQFGPTRYDNARLLVDYAGPWISFKQE
jgi:hypothetical protein